jgi:molecular chaperone DnaK (HSP70)
VEGQPPSRVTLTHPAAWGPFRLDKLRAVAAEAGIEHLDLLAEPVAAALGNADRLTDGTSGGVRPRWGTFDAAVVSVGEHRIVGSPRVSSASAASTSTPW